MAIATSLRSSPHSIPMSRHPSSDDASGASTGFDSGSNLEAGVHQRKSAQKQGRQSGVRSARSPERTGAFSPSIEGIAKGVVAKVKSRTHLGGTLLPTVESPARRTARHEHEKRPPSPTSKVNQYKEAFWREVDQHAKVPDAKKHMARAVMEMGADLVKRMRKDSKSVSQHELESFARQVTEYFGIDWKESTRIAATKYPWVNIPSNLIGLGATYAAATSPPARALTLMALYVAVAFIPLFVAHSFVFQAQFRANTMTAKVTSDSVKTKPLPEVARDLPRTRKELERAIANLREALGAPQADSAAARQTVENAVSEVRRLVDESVKIESKFLVEKEATRYTTIVRQARAAGSIGAAMTGIIKGDPVTGAHVLSAVVAGQIIGQVFASYPDTERKQKAQAELSLRAFDPCKEAGLEPPAPGEATDEQVQKFMYTLGRKMFGGEFEQRIGFVEKALAPLIREPRQEIGVMMNPNRPDGYRRMLVLEGKKILDEGETQELAGLRADFQAAVARDGDGKIPRLAEQANRIQADVARLRDRGADWDEMSDVTKKVIETEFGALGNSWETLKRVFVTGTQNLGEPEMSVPLAINKVVQTLTLVFGGPSSPQLAGALARYFELPTIWAAGVVGTMGLAALYGAGFGPLANTYTVAMRGDLLARLANGTLDLQRGWRGIPGGAKMFMKHLPGGIMAQVNVQRRLATVDKHAREAGKLLVQAEDLLTSTAPEAASPATDAGGVTQGAPVMRGARAPATPGSVKLSSPPVLPDKDADAMSDTESEGGVPLTLDKGLPQPDDGAAAEVGTNISAAHETLSPDEAAFALGAEGPAELEPEARQNVPSMSEIAQTLRTSLAAAASGSDHGTESLAGDVDSTDDDADSISWEMMTPSGAGTGHATAAAADWASRATRQAQPAPEAASERSGLIYDNGDDRFASGSPGVAARGSESEGSSLHVSEAEGDQLSNVSALSPTRSRAYTRMRQGSISPLVARTPESAASRPSQETLVEPMLPGEEFDKYVDRVLKDVPDFQLTLPESSQATGVPEGMWMAPAGEVSSGFAMAAHADLGRPGPGGRAPSSVYSTDGGSARQGESPVSSLRDADIAGAGSLPPGAASFSISSLSLSTQGEAPGPGIQPAGSRPESSEGVASAPAADTQKKRKLRDVVFGKWRRKDGNAAEAGQAQGREKGSTMRALLNRFKSKAASAGGAEGAQSGTRKPGVLRKPPTSVDFIDQLRNRGRSSRHPAPAAPQPVMSGAVGAEPRGQRNRFLSKLGIRR